MGIVHEYSQAETTHDRHSGMSWDEGWVYQLLHCPACQQVMLRRYYWHEGMYDPEEGVEFETLFPADNRKPLGLPEHISRALEAAHKVKNIDANSFAVLLGRVLEMVCEDRDAEGDTLHKQLADLAKKNEIPEKLVGVADGLRHLRNVGAHASIGELTENEIPILDDLARAVIEYVYTAPHLAEEAKRRLEGLKKVSKLRKAGRKPKKKRAKE